MRAKAKAEAAEQQAATFDRQVQTRKQKSPAGQGDGGQQQPRQSRGQLTDVNIARQYLQKAGGDKAKAQSLAKADGWEW